MIDSQFGASPPSSVVDLSAQADDALLVVWGRQPGRRPRAVTAAVCARIDALAEAVTEAETTRDPEAVERTRGALGRALYEVLDGPERALAQRCQDIAARGARRLALVIRLRSAAVHERAALARHPCVRWRWELLADAHGPLATRRGGVAISVQLGDQSVAAPVALPHGGLRILFMASSPRGVQPVLDYEREEEHVLRAVAPFVKDGRARLRVVEQGSLESLERCLLGRAYDIVHLSGHGELTPAGPRLLMEDNVGGRCDVGPQQLLEVLRRAHDLPALVMISACYSGGSRNGIPSLAAQLVAGGIPTVVGWVQPVRDDLATEAAGDIYQRLCTGKTVAQAVSFARQRLHDTDQKGLPSVPPTHTWGTLQLLTDAASDIHLDAQRPPLSDEPAGSDEAYTYLSEGRVRVLERGFVGRRRELQRLLFILMHGKDGEGERCAGAIILGMKGVGKSCLAARAVQRLAQGLADPSELGQVVLHGALDEFTVLEQFEMQAIRWGDRDAEDILSDAREPLPRRLRRLLAGRWRTRRLVIVLDNFEHNLTPRAEGDALLHPEVAALLDALVPACRTGHAKLLVTTTASFELPASARRSLPVIRLGPFEPSSLRKLWNRSRHDEPGADQARSAGASSTGSAAQLDEPQWMAMCDRLGRNPRVIDWARSLLSGTVPATVEILASSAGLTLSWQAGDLPSADAETQLRGIYLHHLSYQHVLTLVSVDARRLVKRARVFEVAVPKRAFAGLCAGVDVDLDAHLPALQNLGLLEAGELDGVPAYRVSPLVEPFLDVPGPSRWHEVAAEFWEEEGRRDDTSECMQWAWEHSLAAGRQVRADRTGWRLHQRLLRAGSHHKSQSLAERHLAVFPFSAVGHAWLGIAVERSGEPLHGWSHYRRAESLAETVGCQGVSRAELLRTGGEILRGLGRYVEARARLEQAVELDEHSETPDSASLASSLLGLARVLHAQGEFESARVQLERSLVLHTNTHGTVDHPHVTDTLYELAQILRSQGDLDGARDRLERALRKYIARYGTDEHVRVVGVLHALAGVRLRQGDLDGSHSLLERSLALTRSLHGSDVHPLIARALHELGRVRFAQGRLVRGRECLERALDLNLELYRTYEHPDVASVLYELGRCLHVQGELDSAREHLERSLRISQSLYRGKQHPHVAGALHGLGLVLCALGELHGARAHLERALEIGTALHGTDLHFRIAETLHELARVLGAQGDAAGARERFERVLAICAAIYETDHHPQVASSLYELGRVLCMQGEFVGASQRLERSLAISTALYGTEAHMHVAGALHELGRVRHFQGDLRAALDHLGRAQALNTAVYGTEQHLHIAENLYEQGRVYETQDQRRSARERYAQALRIVKSCLGTREHRLAAEIELGLGLCLLQDGSRDEAQPLLSHAATLLAAQSPQHPRLEELRQRFPEALNRAS
ncbi:tetratricopeptide repeat protein [Haliangium ochraceum]|uniref:Tetratricopeptide TPR_4 n=1 Tax=Haliangium ochraceum (strain DSM 14365 / JCM 11303 / SMP-2) TaxID=502025 RepID=D0LTC7_HALO1|nr:tetratricopeptide repeat protein [Haliangium ochraceum]ACY13822.1 Tetratricopeptide TPR_4 [Haliangium ochraceum DSM 14365]